MESICSTALGAALKGKTWWPFSRQRVTMTSTIAGSSSMITILAIRSAENISLLRKRKREHGKSLRGCHGFTMEHEPWNFADKIENCLVNGFRRCKRQSYHICQ